MGATSRVIITPAKAAVNPCPGLFAGWGSVSYNSPAALSDDELCLCTVTGHDADGREVIALLDEPPTDSSAPVMARAECTFTKPKSTSHGAACQLPLLALTAAAALHAVGLPSGKATIGTTSPMPAHVLVAGSSGRLPGLLVQVLRSRGARVSVAAQDDGRQLRDLGADEIIRHNEDNFLTVVAERRNRPLDAVLDTVGAEEPMNMRQQVGCAYVSLAPPGLLRLCEEGAPAVLSGWMEQWGKPARTAQRVWVADELACQSLREVLELIDDGQLTPPPEANEKLELTQQYLEYVNWARDAETGLRWGFPGESMWPEEKEAPVPPAVRWGVVPEMRLPDEKMPRGADPVEWMRKRLIAEEWGGEEDRA